MNKPDLLETVTRMRDIEWQDTAHIGSRSRISEVIRKGIEKKRIRQRELAKTLGVTDSLITSWVNGRAIPSTELLLRLTVYLDIMPELFEEFFSAKATQHKNENDWKNEWYGYENENSGNSYQARGGNGNGNGSAKKSGKNGIPEIWTEEYFSNRISEVETEVIKMQKEHFLMKRSIQDLQVENENLKSRIKELESSKTKKK